MDRVNEIVEDVAREWDLPLKTDKTECIFRTKRKGNYLFIFAACIDT